MSIKLFELSSNAFIDEQNKVKSLLNELDDYNLLYQQIAEKAKDYLVQVRNVKTKPLEIEAFLKEYGLDTKEGLVLMSLAEAMLRIPDKRTVDELISDKFRETEWIKYLTKDNGLFVNSATIGLAITSGIINSNEILPIVGGLIKKLGAPIVRVLLKQTVELMGSEFVIAENVEKALLKASKEDYKINNYLFSFDILGEGARTEDQAKKYFDAYLNAIELIGQNQANIEDFRKKHTISIKLSAIHPRYELIKKERVLSELLANVKKLVLKAKEKNIAVTIDAEEASRLDISLMIFESLLKDKDLQEYNGLGMAVQAYQKRALDVIEYVANVASIIGKKVPIRLVKGAYWDAEIKKAQILGLEGYPVYTNKAYTDISYLAAAKRMLELPVIYPQFATHNALTIASIVKIAGSKTFEFQKLFGMGDSLYNIVNNTENCYCRIYAPIGKYEDLLSYLIRRMLENGANTSFLHQLANNKIEIDKLITNQLDIVKHNDCMPAGHIKLPECIYKDNRVNSKGIDMGNLNQINNLEKSIKEFNNKLWQACPIIAGKEKIRTLKDCYQPANYIMKVGLCSNSELEDIEEVVTVANKAYLMWKDKDISYRTSLAEKFADMLEAKSPELIALCIREAGKTLADSIAEIREAIDFCRYYAIEARKLFNPTQLDRVVGESNSLYLYPRGVVLCISPWNFPIAIFIGQIMAAIVTGNSVIAKPSEQTPLISAYLVRMMQECGFDEGVINLMPGPGEVIGKILVSHEKIKAVVFTGSNDTAKNINKTLAERNGEIIPLIAETGGQNCMIVDSSSLIEQAVDDVILSAFGSAGQRCSALRVLYIQNDIADNMINMLKGAMKELYIGDGVNFQTDIGPVIDKNAYNTINEYINKMSKEGKVLYTTPLHEDIIDKGYYIAPTLLEINSISELEKKEIFGPVLHLIRYNAADYDKVIEEINSTGYGLTFGVHSRIDNKVNDLARRINSGNIYINRSMIGAVVGCQPFGGEGLSGTGPKAGGPMYLYRFVTERCVTINTAAIGGNIELLK